MEKIRGIVQRVIFKNEDSGYAVVSLKVDYDDPETEKYRHILISNSLVNSLANTLVNTLANTLVVTCCYSRIPIPDEEYEYTGEFVCNKYGLQLKADHAKQIGADSLKAVVSYLSGGDFPGVGRITAKKIYDLLGKDCLRLIREDPEALKKVPGLKREAAENIRNVLLSDRNREVTIIRFTEIGFTVSMAGKIEKALTSREVAAALINPYLLIGKVEGIAFTKADRIALGNGFRKNDPRRLKAAVVFYLNKETYDSGNCYLEKDILREKVMNRLNGEEEEKVIDEETFEKLSKELSRDGKIYITEQNFVYDPRIYRAEEQLAANIVSRLRMKPIDNFGDKAIEAILKKVRVLNHIKYNGQQEQAIVTALKKNISIVTGGPGTGKTTIVKAIIDAYLGLHMPDDIIDEVFLLAPTGRAAKRLNELTGYRAQTIHKFLGFDGKRFAYGEKNKIFARMIIVDEMSMVDVDIASRLFGAVPGECKIVMVGDADQIPSVGPGEVLSDMIETKQITTIKLTEIHRQAENSSIVSLAHSINKGIVPEDIKEKKEDRNFIYLRDEKISENIVFIVKQALSKKMNILTDIQVLIPMYDGELGINRINEVLQDCVNPMKEGDRQIIASKRRFRLHDKVIQLINRNEEQIMNGDIGYVFDFICTDKKITGMTIQFDGGRVDYSEEEYEQLGLAYAISIHKSQGSEFKTVIIPFTCNYYPMLRRKLYYTAITRAKSYLIMLGDYESLKKAAMSPGYHRKTRLTELVKEKKGKEITPYDFM